MTNSTVSYVLLPLPLIIEGCLSPTFTAVTSYAAGTTNASAAPSNPAFGRRRCRRRPTDRRWTAGQRGRRRQPTTRRCHGLLLLGRRFSRAPYLLGRCRWRRVGRHCGSEGGGAPRQPAQVRQANPDFAHRAVDRRMKEGGSSTTRGRLTFARRLLFALNYTPSAAREASKYICTCVCSVRSKNKKN